MAAISNGTTPRAIETVYRGYRFRSRLEARWAVWLDALGVDWDYEPEGFDLPYGTGTVSYLPDFWLPREQAWLEIKPDSPSVEDIGKMHALALATDRPVVCLIGRVWRGEYFGVIAWTQFGEFRRISEIAPCRKCKALNYLCEHDGGFGSFAGCCDTEKWPAPEGDRKLQAAYEAARSARFGKGGRG
jgi:hypothetical protein